jgi:UPF0755 protein
MSRRPCLWLAAGLAGAAACSSPEPPQEHRVRVTIPRGATLEAVAESLASHGIIASPRAFRFYTRLRGHQRQLPAGTFDLPRGLSAPRALALLLRARVAAQLDIPVRTLEGYLYPSTYLVPVNASAETVVRQMTAEFERRWRPSWTERLRGVKRTRHEIVVLASIIEGEVRDPRDAYYVSSVYHNRLARGMRLQADPTVIYALGRRRRLYERDYRTPSPYNTYVIDGLPPNPIGQPSSASLHAALFPERTDFLFFVARPDGSHVFSRTLREHLSAIAAVRSEPTDGAARSGAHSRPQ